jgi:RHS repeat-associated protein
MQRNGSRYDLLQVMTYNLSHQPLSITDAGSNTMTYTYTAEGQIETILTPQRAGISETRTTTYAYDEDGYLDSVAGPATGDTTSYTYDSYGRTRTATDSDGYSVTFDYDALDRETKVTYPDTTYQETLYERLDPVASRDRLARWTHYAYDPLRRLTATVDPGGRTVVRQWCSCGALESLVDSNGNKTTWERDIQGRVTTEIQPNEDEWIFDYENTTSRLARATDPLGQHRDYTYHVDDNRQRVSYPNALHATHDVTFTYDPIYNRLLTLSDGSGTTTLGYHPITDTPSPGAGKLATIDGPLANDITTYSYDELGRVTTRAIDGVPTTYTYDVLGRVTVETNALGSFSYEYEGTTGRLRTVTYPNGQTTTYDYYSNTGDHRLRQLHQMERDVSLSEFTYAYDSLGNIASWEQQQDSSPAKAYSFEYDRVNQLKAAVLRTADSTPTILKQYAYSYDTAGNRTVEQIDGVPLLSAYDNMNRLTGQTPGGAMRLAGILDEAATVTIQSLPATVSATHQFERGVQVVSGTNSIVVTARDYSGNERTNTYEIDVSGNSMTISTDANGNVTSDGTLAFEWDAQDRLVTIRSGADCGSAGTSCSEFSYDGYGRRIRIVEKVDGATTSDQRFVWCGSTLCEERNSGGGTVNKRFFALGVDVSSTVYFYTRDHLGSVIEVTDWNGDVQARYEYGPFGRRTKVAGSSDAEFGYTGYYVHEPSGLNLARYREYSSDRGRWMNRDPLGAAAFQSEGTNLYTYVRNMPLIYTDRDGLRACPPTETYLPGLPIEGLEDDHDDPWKYKYPSVFPPWARIDCTSDWLHRSGTWQKHSWEGFCGVSENPFQDPRGWDRWSTNWKQRCSQKYSANYVFAAACDKGGSGGSQGGGGWGMCLCCKKCKGT